LRNENGEEHSSNCEPAISIEVEFSLDLARCTVEPSQILRGLFEHTGGLLTLGGLLQNTGPQLKLASL
jgi:hypothetical protein